MPKPVKSEALKSKAVRAKPASLHIDYLDIDGRQVPVTAMHNPRAHRIIVRVDLAAGSVQVTSPSKRGALENAGPVWRRPASETLGRPEICITGEAEFIQRRVTDWLKARAREDLNETALAYADTFDVRPARITMRDQTSRWGSCSTTRSLSFSWRLIMAPPHVLDYVAAHEVAHLRHMNHGARFWSLVESAIPNYESAKRWLEINGPGLHRYGIDPFGASDLDD